MRKTAMRSCMLRVPGSLNAECIEEKIDPEVKIIQEWDGYRPDYRLLLGRFYADLVGKRQKEKERFQNIQSKKGSFCIQNDPLPTIIIPWIEKLLQTPIMDFRKHARDLIIIPYLVLRKGITDPEQIFNIVMQWADKCANLRRLDPSRREFAAKVRSRTYEVMRDRISHMSLQRLKEKNPDLYRRIRLRYME